MALMRRKDDDRALALAREWSPFDVMQDLMSWDPFMDWPQSFVEKGSFVPSFEVKETKDEYIVRTDIPGVKESDVEVSLAGNVLTISGQRQEEHRDENDRYYAYERRYGRFSRSFELPDGIDADKVRADLEDGVLTVTMPKNPEAQPKRIPLKSASNGDQASEPAAQ